MGKIDIKSSEYPYLLKQIKDPPSILYFKGEWNPCVFDKTLSVVGSRKMTRYGEYMTDELVAKTAASGITTVSGFMHGIDACAHESAVNASGTTIAVLACGIGRIHPEDQSHLYNRIILSGGLILSEYPGNDLPALWNYPRRNRIIAALSPLLLIVEAGIKSGALITAKIARKYNRKIYAVPGPLTSSVSMGTAKLIKEGASIVMGAEDLLGEYGIFHSQLLQGIYKGPELKGLQKRIAHQLKQEPCSIDELTRILGIPIAETGAELTKLCLRKILRFIDGKYYLGAAYAD